MSKEQFNPGDPKYKKVEDLPEDEKENFTDVEGGFTRKEAVNIHKVAELAAILEKQKSKKANKGSLNIQDSISNKLREIAVEERDRFFEQLSRQEDCFNGVSPETQKKLIMEALTYGKTEIIKHASEEVLFDKKFVLKSLNITNIYPHLSINNIYKYLPETIRGDKTIAKKALELDPHNISEIPHKKIYGEQPFESKIESDLLNDRELIITAIKGGSSSLFLLYHELIPEKFLNDKEIALMAIKNEPMAIKFFGLNVQTDQEVALKLLKSGYFDFISEEAKKKFGSDKKFILSTVKTYPYIFKYASPDIKADSEIIARALKLNGAKFFQYFDWLEQDKFCSDINFMTNAVRIDPKSFEYASEELRDSKELAIEAIKGRDCDTFTFVSERLKGDKEIILEAIKTRAGNLGMIPEELKSNKDLILEVIKINWKSFEFVSEKLKSDINFIVEAVKINPQIYDFINPELQKQTESIFSGARDFREKDEFEGY